MSVSKNYVYRYIDNNDGIIKYVGITSRDLKYRVEEHKKYDAWVKNSNSWRIEYFIVSTKSQSEAWESHLIAMYETYNWYNIAKAYWGFIAEFMNVNIKWRVYSDNDEVINIPYDYLPVIYDTRGMITDQQIYLEHDIPLIDIWKLSSKKVIQALAKTKDDNLLYLESDLEKLLEYEKTCISLE